MGTDIGLYSRTIKGEHHYRLSHRIFLFSYSPLWLQHTARRRRRHHHTLASAVSQTTMEADVLTYMGNSKAEVKYSSCARLEYRGHRPTGIQGTPAIVPARRITRYHTTRSSSEVSPKHHRPLAVLVLGVAVSCYRKAFFGWKERRMWADSPKRRGPQNRKREDKFVASGWKCFLRGQAEHSDVSCGGGLGWCLGCLVELCQWISVHHMVRRVPGKKNLYRVSQYSLSLSIEATKKDLLFSHPHHLRKGK